MLIMIDGNTTPRMETLSMLDNVSFSAIDEFCQMTDGANWESDPIHVYILE